MSIDYLFALVIRPGFVNPEPTQIDPVLRFVEKILANRVVEANAIWIHCNHTKHSGKRTEGHLLGRKLPHQKRRKIVVLLQHPLDLIFGTISHQIG